MDFLNFIIYLLRSIGILPSFGIEGGTLKVIIMKSLKSTRFLLSFLIIINLNVSAQTFAYGNYTGTGAAKSITGLGFSPEAIIIKSQGAYEAIFTTANMAAGKTKGMGTATAALITGEVTSLDADGFTLSTGDRANKAATQYQWIAFNESTNIHIGTYVGNNDWTAEVVTGCGFSPEAIIICGDAAAAHSNTAFLTQDGLAGNEGFFTHSTTQTGGADFVNTFGADGWTTGGGGDSPIWATTYYYLALNEAANSIKDAAYTVGDGTADYAVTGLGASATFLIIKKQDATPVFTTAASAANKTHYFTATSSAANHIKSMDADGFTAAASSATTNVAWQAHSYLGMAGGTSLPVQMTSFEAIKNGEDVVLSWQTASEINSDHFEILHSTDGVHFESIGTVAAQGNTSHWTDYSFVHENPEDGIHYYQLSEYDADGKNEKFKVLAVNINNMINAITQLFPNPSSNNITLYYNSTTGGSYKVNITDINGNALYFAHIPSMIGENKFRMTVEPYEEGTYFINLTDPSGAVSFVKVMKKE